MNWGKKRGWRWIISPFSSSTFTALHLSLLHLHVSEAFLNYLGSSPRSCFICHQEEAGWGERGAEKAWGLWEQRESELMVLVRGQGYQDWSSCCTFSLVLTLIYKDNYATADKTKYMLHALQRRCCNVSSHSWEGGLGRFILHLWGCLLERPPSMTTQSRAVTLRYRCVSLELPPRHRHLCLQNHIHTNSKSPPSHSHPFFNSAESAVAEVTISCCSRGDIQGEKDWNWTRWVD